MRALHPDLTDDEKAARLALGVELFNRQDFFAAHEPWEEVWRSTNPEPRSLFQGLVQVAAGFHHFQSAGRRGSALRLLQRGCRHLEAPAREIYGLDLAGFRGEIEAWRHWLESSAAQPPPPWPTLTRCRTAGASPTTTCG